MSTYRDRLQVAWNDSEDWCARCQHCDRQLDALLAVRDEELAQLREQLAALMDPDGAERIKTIEAELEALPEDERIRREAQSAPYLRIELAAWVRKAKEAKAELDKTAESAAKEIWVKMGFDTILHWKARAEQAEAEVQHLERRVQAQDQVIGGQSTRLEQAEAAIERVLVTAADKLDALPAGGEALKGPHWYRQGVADAANLLRDWADSGSILAAFSPAGGSENKEDPNDPS